MKLQALVVLGICLAQMCFESVNSRLSKIELKIRAHQILGDVSERFVDDALVVMDKFENDYAVVNLVSKSIFGGLMKILKYEEVSKIDVNSIKKYKTNYPLELSAEEAVHGNDALLTFQSILLTRVPSEIANGMMNLLYATTFPNATTEDMENAVDFLYSNETSVITDPFRNFQVPSASECPKNAEHYSAVQDKLKAMTFIKPSVLEDVAIIIEKFPCSKGEVPMFLEDFVKLIIGLQSIAKLDQKPISACLLKEHSKVFDSFSVRIRNATSLYTGEIARDEIEHQLKIVDLILATRLTDERFRGIFNFEKVAAAAAETPIDEIQKALEYVFVDVAPSAAECSTEELLGFLESSFFRATYENFQAQYSKNEERFELVHQ